MEYSLQRITPSSATVHESPSMTFERMYKRLPLHPESVAERTAAVPCGLFVKNANPLSKQAEAVESKDALSASDQVPVAQAVLYNHKMMRFLKMQLDSVSAVKPPLGVCPESAAQFKQQIAKGHRLLANHANPASLLRIYTIKEVHSGIVGICERLREILQSWNLHCTVHLSARISGEDVEADRKHLHSCLKYVYKGDCAEVDDATQQQWRYLKDAYERKLAGLVVDADKVQLICTIKSGGWSVVYKAEWSGETVAVKMPTGEVDIEGIAILMNEAIVQASLHHDNIVSLRAVTTRAGLVMELASMDLDEYCEDRSLDWNSRVDLMEQAATGMNHLHSKDLVHYDVKPQNILVFKTETQKIRVKVSDFGQTVQHTKSRSKSVRTGGGTPRWIAPESYHGRPLTLESDVYSFGLVMYKIVTGQQPYACPMGGTEQYYIFRKLYVKEEPCMLRDEDCPLQMMNLLRKCCDQDPGKRPSMQDVVRILRGLPRDWEYQVQHYAPC